MILLVDTVEQVLEGSSKHVHNSNMSGKRLHTAQAIAALLFVAMLGLIFSLTRFQNKDEQEFGDDHNSLEQKIIADISN